MRLAKRAESSSEVRPSSYAASVCRQRVDHRQEHEDDVERVITDAPDAGRQIRPHVKHHGAPNNGSVQNGAKNAHNAPASRQAAAPSARNCTTLTDATVEL